MTSRYRVEYALKTHKRDELIEWIKGLLAVPFVLHGDIEKYDRQLAGHDIDESKLEIVEKRVEKTLQTRYLEVFEDVEKLIEDTILLDEVHKDPHHVARSRLRQLVPTVGKFFTKLPLREAFLIEDKKRLISRRNLVSPSFNDIRSILNTAQVLALTNNTSGSKVRLMTFDGDVTLYEDGKNLSLDSPLVSCLVRLLANDLYVAVVTAAGYPGHQGALSYQSRLNGLIEQLKTSTALSDRQKNNFLIMGGESNYLFRYDSKIGGLRFIDGDEWYLPLMRSWDQSKILETMDVCHEHIVHLQKKFRLDDDAKTKIIRKERSLGIIPVEGYKISREILEEMVLSVLARLNEVLFLQKSQGIHLFHKTNEELPEPSGQMEDHDIRACAFNGGADVWVDIGDKSLGVAALQQYLYSTSTRKDKKLISHSESLHIGDQFASVGANDFKARLSACTVWISSPRETEEILEELIANLESEAYLQSKR
ncbi:hypothetical protein PUMCH_000353 [Australozyma saopauloensis]|uniref:IMP-specific 5'-nucleotidase 1 n=1 Tax=Australozyma saopauloensis TaxID=291208 RepID=A0AAX4H3P9_9ASCO|nr:hypothetical protein PUMCH_000353 [[Candida] saopauloensis]